MKTLRLKFGTADGKNRTLSLRYARQDATEEEVRTAMRHHRQQYIYKGLVSLGPNL